jgi:hypothetical protein
VNVKNGSNPDQQLLIIERLVKDKLRKYFTRNYGGFYGISRRTPPETVGYYCTFSTPEFVAAAGRKDVNGMKGHRMLEQLTMGGYLVASFRVWKPCDTACRTWAQEVIDSLHRCGLPFNDDREAMEQHRLKANEERAKRRVLMAAS